MFDVIWTDPDRELVGERRARKIVEKEQKEKEKKHGGRSSMSIRSSSSSGDRPFAFFGSKSLKRVVTPSKAPSTATSGLFTPSVDIKSRRSSIFGVSSILSAAELHADSVQPPSHPAIPDQFVDSGLDSPSTSSRGSTPDEWFYFRSLLIIGFIDSIFSKWTDQSLAASGSNCGTSLAESTHKSSVIQTLGPSSYITKSTEIKISTREPGTEIGSMFPEITITADASKDVPPTPPKSPREMLVVIMIRA
jgi:hypothetical protein